MLDWIVQVGAWLESTELAHLITGPPWVWPTFETLHFIGMAMLFGAVGMLDLRLLGLAKWLPVHPLHRIIHWGVAGFVINLVTGVLFFIGAAHQYTNNIAFGFKMIFIVLAGINVLVFYLAVGGDIDKLEGGQEAPPMAKVTAGVSLFLWIGVMFWGRMLPYIGNSF